MNLKFLKGTIVILAQTHNPSIFNYKWIKEKGIIDEEPKQLMNNIDLALFDSDNILITLDINKLIINTKKADVENLRKISNIAIKYVSALPDIPYTFLGLNYIWNLTLENREDELEINLSINGIDDFSKIIPDHRIDFGAIIYAYKQPYRLKLSMDKRGENSFEINFNYHHEIKGLSSQEIVSYINKYLELYEFSDKIVTKLYKPGEAR